MLKILDRKLIHKRASVFLLPRDMDGDVDIDLPEVSLHILLWRVGFSDCPQSFLHSQCHSEL